MIKWTEQTVKLKDLKPYENNPRNISKENFQRLVQSIKQNGYNQRLICTQDMKIISGHQRMRALKEIGIKEVQILTPDRELTEQEFKEILIKDNLHEGSFDLDILSVDFDIDELLSMGFPKSLLGEEPKELKVKTEDKTQKLCPNCGETLN